MMIDTIGRSRPKMVMQHLIWGLTRNSTADLYITAALTNE